MHRTPSPARIFAILVAALMLPVIMVRAQEPPASPTAEEHCTPADVDPTKLNGNDIVFVRLAGPPAGTTEGPSLYQVDFGLPNSWYFGGCELEPVAIYVSSGPLYLRAFSGTTDVFYSGDLPSPDCKTINEKPEHEPRNVCELGLNGAAAKLNDGDQVFHDGEATYEYATSEDLLGLNTETILTNAMAAGTVPRRANAAVPDQAPGDPSIVIASGRKKPKGCGGECL